MIEQLKMKIREFLDKKKVAKYGESYLFKRITNFYRGGGHYYYCHGDLPKEEFLLNEVGLTLSEWLDEDRAIETLQKYWISDAEYDCIWKKTQESVFKSLVKKEMFYYPWRTFQSSWHIRGYFGDTEGPFLDRNDLERLKGCLIECGEKTIIIAEEGKSGPFPIRLRLPVMITWEDIWKGGFLLGTFLYQDYSNFYIFGEKPIWGKYVATESDRVMSLIAFSEENKKLLDLYVRDIDLEDICFTWNMN